MQEQCAKTESGKDLVECEDLTIFMQTGFASREVFSAKLKSTGERLHRVAIATKKMRGKYAVFTFCPFCGADIDTSSYGLGESKQC